MAPGGNPLTLSQSGRNRVVPAEKSGKLLPATRPGALSPCNGVMQAASDISGTSNAVFHTELRVPEKSAANLDYLKKRLLTYFAVCDRQLQGRDFLTGELSVADLMLYPNFAARKALLDEVGGLANLQRWGAAMAARPGVARGMRFLG